MSSSSFDPAASISASPVASATTSGDGVRGRTVERASSIARSRYVQVAATYWTRPRFWIMGATYLALVYWWLTNVDSKLQVTASTNLAAVLVCLVALHVRRQFGAPAAHLQPRFAAPHVTVAALVAGFGWLIVPLLEVAIGNWPWGGLAFHAAAGILGAAVVCWPKAMLALAGSPLAVLVSFRMTSLPDTFLSRLLSGEEPGAGWTLFALAIGAQGVAAWFLLRQTDRSVPFGDEVALEPSVAHQSTNRAAAWLLGTRDAAAARMLELSGGRFWSITRWRVPVAVSWAQWAAPVAFVLSMVAITLVRDDSTWMTLGAMLTTCILVVVPFSGWHSRRRSAASELLRPVSRRQFYAEQATALAFDVGLWNLLSSAIGISAIGFVATYYRDGISVEYIGWHLLIQWSLAIFAYGIALATIRLHYWVFLITALGTGWLCGYWITLAVYCDTYDRDFTPIDAWVFVAITLVLGLATSWIGFRRMLAAELH